MQFSVNVTTIHQGKHGSDTESYDTEGRFVPVIRFPGSLQLA